MNYEYRTPQRMQDARMLDTFGFGPVPISELTGWTLDMIISMREQRTGRKKKNGARPRTDLLDLLKLPVFHATVSVFVQALEHQLKFLNTTRLNARAMVTSLQYTRMTVPEFFPLVPISAFLSVARCVADQTVRTGVCTTCKYQYAVISLEANLTQLHIFGCPLCRMVNLMLPSQRRAKTRSPLASFADLNLNIPFNRVYNREIEPSELRAILDLGYRPRGGIPVKRTKKTG